MTTVELCPNPESKASCEDRFRNAQRLSGIVLAIGVAVHLFGVRGGGEAALISRLANHMVWQIVYGLLVVLALIHVVLGLRIVWAARHQGLSALTLQRVSGLGMAFFVPLHVGLAVACIASPALTEAVLNLYAQPLHRWPESVVVALVVCHGLNGLGTVGLEKWPWSWGRRLLPWLVLGLTAMAAVAVLFRIW